MDEVSDVIASVTAEELERICVPPSSPGHPRKDHTVLQCLQVILKEEWQHQRAPGPGQVCGSLTGSR